MSAKLTIKRGKTASWNSSAKDTTLEPGQLGAEYQAGGFVRLKIGKVDSTADFSLCEYITPDMSIYQGAKLAGNGSYTVSCGYVSPYNSTSGYLGTPSLIWGFSYVNNSYTSTLYPIGGNSTGSIGLTSNRWANAFINSINCKGIVASGSSTLPELYSTTSTTTIANISSTYTGNIYPYTPTDSVKIRSAANSSGTYTTISFANDAVYPNPDNQIDLGSANGYMWKRGYFRNLYIGSQRVPAVFTGSGAPSASTGVDGDVYIQYV